MERDAPPKVTDTLDLLREKTLELRTGDIDQAAFLAHLERLEATFRASLETVAEVVPETMEAEMAEELEAGRQGILVFLESVSSLREWAQTGEKALLDAGLALATQATAHVNEAIRLNWRSFKTYQESAREYLQQVGRDADV